MAFFLKEYYRTGRYLYVVGKKLKSKNLCPSVFGLVGQYTAAGYRAILERRPIAKAVLRNRPGF